MKPQSEWCPELQEENSPAETGPPKTNRADRGGGKGISVKRGLQNKRLPWVVDEGLRSNYGGKGLSREVVIIGKVFLLRGSLLSKKGK